MEIPAAEVQIDSTRVRELLAAQHPDLAELPLHSVGSGWDNAMFRLGDNLAVRLPRRQSAVLLLRHEQRWLPQLKDQLPCAIPAPVRTGAAQGWYPWPWSITPWIEGRTADLVSIVHSQGIVLAQFFEALHRPAPQDAPTNPYRGVPLAEREGAFRDRVAQLAGRTTLFDNRALRMWDDALAAPVDSPPTWVHGDLHPRNVLIRDGCISGVIDWGDMARGDRAVDLASVWMVLPDPECREQVVANLRVSDATWRRARGWALFFAAIMLDAGLSGDPPMARIAALTIERLLRDV